MASCSSEQGNAHEAEVIKFSVKIPAENSLKKSVPSLSLENILG
jgi:hypothetical protein